MLANIEYCFCTPTFEGGELGIRFYLQVFARIKKRADRRVRCDKSMVLLAVVSAIILSFAWRIVSNSKSLL